MKERIGKAIEYFEDAVKETDEIISECSSDLQKELIEQKEHFVVALSALKEKLKQSEGCEYCEDETEFDKDVAKYCFHCGRKLGEDNG